MSGIVIMIIICGFLDSQMGLEVTNLPKIVHKCIMLKLTDLFNTQYLISENSE